MFICYICYVCHMYTHITCRGASATFVCTRARVFRLVVFIEAHPVASVSFGPGQASATDPEDDVYDDAKERGWARPCNSMLDGPFCRGLVEATMATLAPGCLSVHLYTSFSVYLPLSAPLCLALPLSTSLCLSLPRSASSPLCLSFLCCSVPFC